MPALSLDLPTTYSPIHFLFETFPDADSKPLCSGSYRGSGGSKDLHLDDFNVSNGGKDLIQDATVTMAWGRRYGLIGRNGTGAQIHCALDSISGS